MALPFRSLSFILCVLYSILPRAWGFMPGLRGDIVTAITKMYPATCTMKIKPRTFSSEGPSLRDATGSVICLQKDESDLKRLKQTEHCDCCNTLQETRTDISCNSHQPGEKNTLTKRERVTLKLLRRDLQRLGLMFSRAKKVEEKVEEKVGKQNAEGLVEEINNYIWEQAVDLLDKPIAHTAVKVFHQSLTMLEKLQVPTVCLTPLLPPSLPHVWRDDKPLRRTRHPFCGVAARCSERPVVPPRMKPPPQCSSSRVDGSERSIPVAKLETKPPATKHDRRGRLPREDSQDLDEHLLQRELGYDSMIYFWSEVEMLQPEAGEAQGGGANSINEHGDGLVDKSEQRGLNDVLTPSHVARDPTVAEGGGSDPMGDVLRRGLKPAEQGEGKDGVQLGVLDVLSFVKPQLSWEEALSVILPCWPPGLLQTR
eukprot:353811-Hanusia_phi.AAC.3